MDFVCALESSGIVAQILEHKEAAALCASVNQEPLRVAHLQHGFRGNAHYNSVVRGLRAPDLGVKLSLPWAQNSGPRLPKLPSHSAVRRSGRGSRGQSIQTRRRAHMQGTSVCGLVWLRRQQQRQMSNRRRSWMPLMQLMPVGVQMGGRARHARFATRLHTSPVAAVTQRERGSVRAA